MQTSENIPLILTFLPCVAQSGAYLLCWAAAPDWPWLCAALMCFACGGWQKPYVTVLALSDMGVWSWEAQILHWCFQTVIQEGLMHPAGYRADQICTMPGQPSLCFKLFQDIKETCRVPWILQHPGKPSTLHQLQGLRSHLNQACATKGFVCVILQMLFGLDSFPELLTCTPKWVLHNKYNCKAL